MQNLKMPAMFIGHGSPMNALAKNDYSKFLNQTGRRIPKPKAILAVSAHWETHGTQVLNEIQPKNIHAKILSPNIIDMGIIYDPNKISAAMIFQKAKQIAERILTQSHASFVICTQGSLRINDFKLLPLDCLRID